MPVRPARVLPHALLTATLALACKGEEPGADATRPAPKIERPTPTPDATTTPDRPAPKLVVVVVVDQMRFDYIERFSGQWNHGFTRLLDSGRVFKAAYHEHAMTETAPGHATISTGTDPADHGIVANGWLDRKTGAKVNAVDDPEATIHGRQDPGDAVGVSSATLLRESFGDWMQAATPEAVVIAMAIKDRAAILLGGKRPDAAIWYDDELGGFTSSSRYGELPGWVTAYNQEDRGAALYGETGWTLSRPPEDYGDSRQLTDPKVVTTFSDYSLTKQFPHVIAKDGKAPRNVVRDTPFGDQMTLELAREAIVAERMGADATPDLLLIGLSAGDYTGHRYGPNSVEIHDYYLRIDAALGEFMMALDEAVGADKYVLILTADHGVTPMPEYSDLETAGRFDAKARASALLEDAGEAAGLAKDELPTVSFTHGVDLDFAEHIDEPTRAKFRAALAELLRADALVADVWTRDELLGEAERNEYADAWRRSFHPERSADLLLQLAPGVVLYPEGTGHGTPYEFDQHVPLVIRGPGWTGVHEQRVSTVDIAPTIAAIVGLPAVTGLDGEAIVVGERD